MAPVMNIVDLDMREQRHQDSCVSTGKCHLLYILLSGL